MKTTSHTSAQAAQIGTIDKVLFALFFTLYVAVIVFASAVLTGCAPADQMVIGIPLEEEVSTDSKQDAGGLKGATNVTGQGGNGSTTDSISSRNGPNSASDTKGGTRTVSDSSNGSSNDGSVNDDGNGDDSDSGDDTNDTDTVNDTSVGIDGKIIVGVQDSSGSRGQGSDIKASVIQDTTVSTTADSNGGRAKDTSSTIQDASTVKDATLADIKGSAILDTKGTAVADASTGTSSDTSAGIGQKPDIITITQDVITTVKDTITDIIKDTSAGIILDIIASTDNGAQKTDSKGQLDIGGASASDTAATPDSQIVKDTSAGQDAQIWYDTQIAKDTQAQQDTQIQPTPDVFIAPNNQTTWYTSKEYKYKVQYPSWVQATVLKTTDLQLTGNVLNKVGLTKQELAGIAHFTLRTEFEYYPSYMTYDGWWKNLYGKPDEVATYQGQTLKYHSADSGGGFNRYTYVKIGKIGSLRIEMNFSMPPHLYVEGFEQKALEVLYMVTKSAQAAN